MMETTIPIVISVIALVLSIFKYLDKSKEKISKAITDIELLKLQTDQVSKWVDHVEKNLLVKMNDQQKQSERLSEKLDEIKDKLNE